MWCATRLNLRASFLFIIYISSIKHTRGKLILLADNTNIFVVHKNESALQHKMIYAMKELVLWFPKNDLIINIEKTVVMFFHSNQFRLPNKP
jgi:hypothetical protein